MRTVTSAGEMHRICADIRRSGRRIAFVPTMGYLHEGHLSLMRIARSTGDVLAVSIFVNPIQFGPGEDFERYPRDNARDDRLCIKAGVDLLFRPDAGGMYAPDHSVFVEETRLSGVMCGASRPGHFKGVTTVVAKLFNIVAPDTAVFGHKDIQQALIIRRMVRDLDFPVEIVIAPIAREHDGLAMSSRNSLLTAEDRAAAPCLWKSLQLAATLTRKPGAGAAAVRRKMAALIKRAAPRAQIDYIEFADCETLRPVKQILGPTLVALAARFGKVRLIDNAIICGGAARQGNGSRP